MTTLQRIRIIALLLCITAASPAAFAQEKEEATAPELEVSEKSERARSREIVVTATKTEIDRRETGASITVITEREIENRGRKTVADALADVPGLAVSQSSAFGGLTSVYIRGTDYTSVLVLVDGVRVNDPSDVGHSYDFANLTTDNVERIEVIRGSQSTLYGSDAIGGVINIITRKGSGKPQLTLKAEGGSYHTFKESIHLSGGDDKAYYSFGAARSDSKGINSLKKQAWDARRPDRDGYTNNTLSSRLGMNPFGEAWISLSLRYTDAETELDDAAKDDPNYTYENQQLSTVLDFAQPIFSWWRHKLSVSYMNIERKDRDRADFTDQYLYTVTIPLPGIFWPLDYTYDSSSSFTGRHKKAEWQHVFTLGEIDEITGGVELSDDSAKTFSYYAPGSTASTFEKLFWTRAYYLQNHLKLLKRIFIVSGVRLTDNEAFHRHWNYQLSGSFILPWSETRLKGNYSTGFKAPSLYQLYDPTYGNKTLRPQESRSYDFGFEQPLWGERIILDVVYFHTYYRNLIEWAQINSTTSMYINRKSAETKGYEGSLTVKPLDMVKLVAAYTYLMTNDIQTGKKLLRRPKHRASLNADWEFLKGANLNLGLVYVGARDDVWYDMTGTKFNVRTNAYYRLDAGLSYQIVDYLQVFGRVENITDRRYESNYNRNSPGRSFYAGIKGTF